MAAPHPPTAAEGMVGLDYFCAAIIGAGINLEPFIQVNLGVAPKRPTPLGSLLLAQNRQADRDRVQIAEDLAIVARQRPSAD